MAKAIRFRLFRYFFSSRNCRRLSAWAAEHVEEPVVAERAATEEFQVASEFTWSALEFTPLVWRYDAEPEAATIDLREPAAVDLREDADRKAPRRKKARR